MSSKLTINGRTYYGKATYQRRHKAGDPVPRDKQGKRINCAVAIQPDPEETKLRAGIPYECPDEKITYRVIRHCDPQQRWASTEFWQRHLRITHKAILRLVRKGWIDAAIEEGSEVRRYRCRDERKMKESWDWRKLRGDLRKQEERARRAEKLKGKTGWGYLLETAKS